MKFKNLEDSIKSAEGNLKHENMKIEEWEKDLIKDFAEGKINRKDLIQKVFKTHENSLNYDSVEEEAISPEYERKVKYKGF